MKNKWIQRLHDKVSGNWQKFTTMVYAINKSRDIKKRTGNLKKSFLIYDNDRKENTLIYAHHIFYKNIRNFCRLFEQSLLQNWIKKNASKAQTTVAYLGHIKFYYLSRAHDFHYFVDRFFFSIISCARLFYFVDRFFFSIISCARLFFIFHVVFSFLLSRGHDIFFYNPTLHIKRHALHM